MAYRTHPDEAFIRARMTESGDGCWIWDLFKDQEGYGRLGQNPAGERRAHRLSFVVFHGEIPDGLTVDHLCYQPSCVNPDHLRLLTVSDNSKGQRPWLKVFKDGRGTHNDCRRGHALTTLASGTRVCRDCNREAVRRYRARKSQAV